MISDVCCYFLNIYIYICFSSILQCWNASLQICRNYAGPCEFPIYAQLTHSCFNEVCLSPLQFLPPGSNVPFYYGILPHFHYSCPSRGLSLLHCFSSLQCSACIPVGPRGFETTFVATSSNSKADLLPPILISHPYFCPLGCIHRINGGGGGRMVQRADTQI